MLKRVKLYVNTTKKKALETSRKVEKELVEAGYEIVDKNADLVIGFGGDGTLLKWTSENYTNTNVKYIGVNCGTLGFMQDFDITDAKEFVKNIPNYIEKKLEYVQLLLCLGDGQYHHYALNEFNVLNAEDKTFKTKVGINGEFLETYVGTGLIFATPTGSTARNISSVGSIMFPEIAAMQMTPIEPIVNSKIHCIPKSICIPRDNLVSLTPANNDKIKVMADGVCVYEGRYEEIIVGLSYTYMTVLTDANNSFVKKIREKLI